MAVEHGPGHKLVGGTKSWVLTPDEPNQRLWWRGPEIFVLTGPPYDFEAHGSRLAGTAAKSLNSRTRLSKFKCQFFNSLAVWLTVNHLLGRWGE